MTEFSPICQGPQQGDTVASGLPFERTVVFKWQTAIIIKWERARLKNNRVIRHRRATGAFVCPVREESKIFRLSSWKGSVTWLPCPLCRTIKYWQRIFADRSDIRTKQHFILHWHYKLIGKPYWRRLTMLENYDEEKRRGVDGTFGVVQDTSLFSTESPPGDFIKFLVLLNVVQYAHWISNHKGCKLSTSNTFHYSERWMIDLGLKKSVLKQFAGLVYEYPNDWKSQQ